MKIGIKLWSINNNLYPSFLKLYAKKETNFLELKYILGEKKDLDLLKKEKVSVILHSQNCIEGVCFSDGKLEKNKRDFKELMEIASFLNAEGIIIHPGTGTKENFIKFLKNVDTSKLIIENMPKQTMLGEAVGYKIEDIKEFLEIANCKFCLDFCHAIKTAISLRIDYKKYIKDFLELDPFMFHICDANLDNPLDEHLDLGKGQFDLKFLKEICKKYNKQVTLETPKTNALDNDIKNMEFLKSIN